MAKKISVLVTFHKYKKYLAECLASLATQNFDDFETILILDHNEEAVADIVKEYQEKLDLKVFELETKTGVAAARNKAIEVASGEYIYFLDSDDYLLDDSLAILIDALENNPDLVYGKVRQTWNKKDIFLEKLRQEEQERLENELASQEENNDNADDEDAEGNDDEPVLNADEVFVANLPEGSNPEQELAIKYVMRKRKGFRNFTVLGSLYRREFIIENHIYFNEEFKYYSDMTFISVVLDRLATATKCMESIYVKRKHNDEINMPALSQIKDDNRFYERLNAVEYTRTQISAEGKARYYLDYKITMFLSYNMARKLRRSNDTRWRNEYFNAMIPVLKTCNQEMVQNLNKYQKSLYKAVIKGNLNKALRIIRKRLLKKKFNKMKKNKNVLYKTAYYHLFTKLKIKNKVVMFESFRGQGYSDSPKYIYEYLNANYSDKYKFIWVLNDSKDAPKNCKVVKRFSFRYVYYLAVSKYLVFNVRQPLFYRKREGQVFLETWHGTPLKRLAFDQEEVTSASPKYKKHFYTQREDWDYLISANHFSSETFKRCFMYENKMLEYGYPRNDILYSENKDELSETIKERIGLPKDKKVILYAPTWRDDEYYDKGQYKFNLKLDLNLLQRELGDEYIILLRMHYYIADNLDISAFEGFAYDVSKYSDISELYLISDMCITDYSSVFFDYANLKRPILFYTYDLDKYRDQLRGFYIDMEKEAPGPLLMTSEEVLDAIKNINIIKAEYEGRYQNFYAEYCSFDDGHASEHVVEEVFSEHKS